MASVELGPFYDNPLVSGVGCCRDFCTNPHAFIGLSFVCPLIISIRISSTLASNVDADGAAFGMLHVSFLTQAYMHVMLPHSHAIPEWSDQFCDEVPRFQS